MKKSVSGERRLPAERERDLAAREVGHDLELRGGGERHEPVAVGRTRVVVDGGEGGPVHVARHHRALPAMTAVGGLEERPLHVPAIAGAPGACELTVDVEADAGLARARPEVVGRPDHLGHGPSSCRCSWRRSAQTLLHPEGELATARAAAGAGTVMCVSAISAAAPAETAAATPGGRLWLQIYPFRDRELTAGLVRQAAAAGFEAVVLTVDATGDRGRREGDQRSERLRGTPDRHLRARHRGHRGPSDGRLTPPELAGAGRPARSRWEDLAWRLGSAFRACPVVLKGDRAPPTTRGSRDRAPAPPRSSSRTTAAAQLDAVARDRSTSCRRSSPQSADGAGRCWVDGGIRRGTDVLAVCLALGARAVLVGRPAMWGLAAGGSEGVARVLALLRGRARQRPGAQRLPLTCRRRSGYGRALMPLVALKTDPSVIEAGEDERAALAEAGAVLVERPCPSEDELLEHGRDAAAICSTLDEPLHRPGDRRAEGLPRDQPFRDRRRQGRPGAGRIRRRASSVTERAGLLRRRGLRSCARAPARQ